MFQTELLDRIAATTKRTEKLVLLKEASEHTREFLKLALDPMTTFGLTVSDEDIEFEDPMEPDEWWSTVKELAERLAKREITGNSAKDAVAAVCGSAPNIDFARWGRRLFNKDLRAGIASGIVLEALPGLFEEFEVFLAKPYDPDKHSIPRLAIFEPKLDGLRMVVIEGRAYTRNGHAITAVDPLLRVLPGDVRDTMVLDGEILGATFDETSGQVRQKHGDGQELVYNVFDVIDLDQWKAHETAPMVERKKVLTEIFSRSYRDNGAFLKRLKMVPYKLHEAATVELAMGQRDQYLALGYEGLMVKDANSGYVWGRSDAMFKLKKMDTADGRIIGAIEGRGKNKGRLGAFEVEFDGVVTKVGGGFTDGQRQMLWTGRDGFIGKMIECQYQNKTKDGALRFPVFIKFRPDKD
jgi:DNA ligase-1